MGEIKVAKIRQEPPRRLQESSEHKRFALEPELFMLLKTDLKFWRNKMVELLNTFVADASNSECVDHDNHDLHSVKIKKNKQPIEDIYDDIIGQYMAEIPMIMGMPKFGGIKEAEHRWETIQSLYTQLETIEDKEGILRVFREIKGGKHGTGDHDLYTLQPGESRLSLLKSALDDLE